MISFVIPLCNEVENLADLHAELAATVASSGLDDVEFLFIDDGSTDGSWRVVEDLAADDPRVRGVRFRRNFGKAAALTAGFRAAVGGLVFTLDGDLQDDPGEIPRFLAKIEEGEGLDLVSGWKRKRHDPWHKVGPSRIFNRLVSRVTGLHLHDHNCGYKLYRRAVLDEVTIYGELHRFVPALAHARGFRIGELEVHHRARLHGRSKYGVSRFLKGLLDLVTVSFLTRYGSRPFHAFGTVGLGFLMLSLIGLAALGVARGFGWTSWPIAPVVLAATSLAIGVQLLATGLVAERLTASRLDPEDTYSIAATVGPASTVRAGGLP
ncbi:MAG TPA: glycosyltransferase family 2 protein [Isosphaeraceae bacterium]|jgi:glycosyltransferase involved in cell wall biosynthesis